MRDSPDIVDPATSAIGSQQVIGGKERLVQTARRFIYVFTANPISIVALSGFAVIIFAAVFGPAIAPYDPLATNAAMALKPPSMSHWFGTDQLGRDVFSRVLVAARLDLFISVSAVTLPPGIVWACALGMIGSLRRQPAS